MTTKKRGSISFDFDHDEDTKILLAEQARLPDSPFEITDASVREPLTGDWEGQGPAPNGQYRRGNCPLWRTRISSKRRGCGIDDCSGEKQAILPLGGVRKQDLHEANISNVIRQGLRVDLGQSEDTDRRMEITSHAKSPLWADP